MGKRLIHDYEFNSDSNKITLNEIITQDRFLLITNVTDGEGLYTFNDPSNGISDISFDFTNTKTTVTLEKDTSAMDSSDSLQIFIEGETTRVEMDETYIDPVAKMRVSQPENLIDTDFEYGLQSTKWETLELVKNIPTFFSRNGDLGLDVTNVESRKDSDVIRVTCGTDHGLSRGTPVLIVGTGNPLADGGFVTTNVINSTIFEYKSKGNLTSTGSLYNQYTQIFVANIYQGTEFDLSGIEAVTTDEASSSKLIVKTQYPTGFTEGTSFFLTNSFAKANLEFTPDANAVDPNNATILSATSGVNNVATGETSGWARGVVQPYNWQPQAITGFPYNNHKGIFFNEEDITIGGTGNSFITFTEPHGLTDVGTQNLGMFIYRPGEGATQISGLIANRPYFWRAYGTNQIRVLFRDFDSTSYDQNLGSQGSNGITKSAFFFGIGISSVQTNGYLGAHFNTYTQYGFVSDRTTIRNNWETSGLARYGFFHNGSPLANELVSNNAQAAVNPNLLQLTKTASSGNDQLLFNYINITNTVIEYYTYRFGFGSTTNVWRSRRNRYYDQSPDGGDGNNLYGLIMPMQQTPDGNSIYIANHGFNTGDIVQVTATAGTLPTGLSEGVQYSVVKINDNRMAFRTTDGADINFTSAGSTDLVINVTGVTLNLNNDTIEISNNTFNNGDEVLYTNNGVTNIPGLTSGTEYYIFEKTGDKFKLATSPTGLSDSTGRTILVDQASSTNIPRINTDGTIFSTSDTLVSGEIVKATQISGPTTSGITPGAFYYIDKASNTLSLYPTDSDRVNDQNQVELSRTSTGTIQLQKTTLVDITGVDSGIHTLLTNFVGAADGVYNIDSAYESDGTPIFTLKNNSQILRRTQTITNSEAVDLYHNAIKLNSHGYITANGVEYTALGAKPIGGLVNGETYYAKRINNNWFRLTSSEADALDSSGVYIEFDSAGTGTSSLKGTSVVGETSGVGTISITENSNNIIGVDTQFTSVFNAGDPFNIYIAENLIKDSVTGFSSSQDYLNINDSLSQYVNGMSVTLSGDAAPGGTTIGQRYYVNTDNGSGIRLYENYDDAVANSGSLIQITSAGTDAFVNRQEDIGSTIESTIKYVNSTTKIELEDNITDSDASELNYSVNSKLLIRADGFALHRPYDGGVELIPSTNPDSQMIRQTRKYFRYQSGKGIQVSFAVNFKPTVDIDLLERLDSVGTITTRYPHRVNITDSADELDIVVKNAIGSPYWNGEHRVLNVVDDYKFEIQLDDVPDQQFARGIPNFYVDGWRNCSLRCGLFDDQNGLFFDFDGDELSAVVRNSTQQVSGFASVQFGSGNVFGTGTKFTEQLIEGESVVIKGQTYVVTKISGDTLFHILPSYRGTATDDVILTKIEDRKVPQSEWNIDKCDGTGKSGFKLDLSKIQMAYIDYSWYGAGKVRFGFKDQHGVVRYCHEFVHGNFQTEAYMRSGNMPARYELKSIGKPQYVPALAHWGTSVIMDGRFDDDKAYVFTANSLTTTLLNQDVDSAGDVTITIPAKINDDDYYYARIQNQNRRIGYAIELDAASSQYNALTAGMPITGAGLQAGTVLSNPIDARVSPIQPYLPNIESREGSGDGGATEGFGSQRSRNLLVVDRKPTIGNEPNSAQDDYVVTIQTGGVVSNDTGNTDFTKDIPIISVRLAPSVDTNTPGSLGEREIINRMQLILNECDILTTHSLEIELRINGQIDNNNWQRVENPSLSQLIFHSSGDTITGGTIVFSFNAQGSDADVRTAVLTAKALGEVATLGNSILGGDAVFPDGPDILTVVGRLKEDPSTVTNTNPLSVQGRISWSESQA